MIKLPKCGMSNGWIPREWVVRGHWKCSFCYRRMKIGDNLHVPEHRITARKMKEIHKESR